MLTMYILTSLLHANIARFSMQATQKASLHGGFHPIDHVLTQMSIALLQAKERRRIYMPTMECLAADGPVGSGLRNSPRISTP